MNAPPRRGTPPALLAVVAVCTVVALAGGPAVPAWTQAVSVDTLVARVITEPNPQPYTMTADFAATLHLTVPTGEYWVRAEGTLVESRSTPGEPRRRRATITRLDLPLLLRPFSGAVRKVVTDLIELEQRPTEFLPSMDVFIAEDRGGGSYLLGGVRADIVSEVMTKYGQAVNLKDTNARRAIARWLWTPSQRTSIVRPGPGPYLFTAVVDETGLMHELTLLYDWGHIANRITFTHINGRPFWREVHTDSSSEVKGIGRVDGTMTLLVRNHCLNCPSR